MQWNRFMLKIDGLSKHYSTVKAVDNVSLEIPAGEMVGIIGRSGAGKSRASILSSQWFMMSLQWRRDLSGEVPTVAYGSAVEGTSKPSGVGRGGKGGSAGIQLSADQDARPSTRCSA